MEDDNRISITVCGDGGCGECVLFSLGVGAGGEGGGHFMK